MLMKLLILLFYKDVFEEPQGKFIHLTNNSVQKKHPNYANAKEETIWDMKRFEEYLIDNKGMNKEKIEEIYKKIKEIITYVIKAGGDKLTQKIGFYELIGCDFILDENCTPYLLEMNTNPALFTGFLKKKKSNFFGFIKG